MGTPFNEWLQAQILAQGYSGPAGLTRAMHEQDAAVQVDRRTVWRWCAGHRLPAQKWWPALASALDVPVDQLALRVVGVEPL